MARAQKLKVYRTPIGFHDAYVAAPSQKAALAAWGADSNLFASGSAERVEDPELAREPLASPGQVIRRLRGTLAEHIAALPKEISPPARGPTPTPPRSEDDGTAVPRPKPRPPAPPRPRPRPDRAALDRAEKALAAAEERHAKATAALARRRAELDREQRALEAQHDRKRAGLERRVDEARDAYERKMQSWRAD